MKKIFRYNGLSIVFLFLFLASLCGQSFTGWKQYNQEMQDKGGQQVNFSNYFSTGHFIEATFENWESEYLQMLSFIALTMFLYQKGSSESKDPDKKEEVDKEPEYNKKDAPWAVRRGGWVLALYKHSLTIIMASLFVFCFCLHWYGSLKQYNEDQTLEGKPTETAMQYLSNSKLWFESFENWQSEFLSVVSIVVLSIYFRQKNSAQSKPVDAPNSKTGN